MEEFKCSYLPNNNIKAWTIRLSPLLPFDSKEFEVYALGKRIYMIIDNYNQGKSVILFGYSAGSFITYEYMFNKFANINVENYFDKENTSANFKKYIKENPKKDTCIDALIDSKLAIYSAEKKLI